MRGRTAEVVADNVYFGDCRPGGGQDNVSHSDDFKLPEGFDPGTCKPYRHCRKETVDDLCSALYCGDSVNAG